MNATMMAKALDRHLMNGPCGRCLDRSKCFDRQEKEPWIFSDQFSSCQMAKEPVYMPDDHWVLQACFNDEGSEPLTPEEEEELAKPIEEGE